LRNRLRNVLKVVFCDKLWRIYLVKVSFGDVLSYFDASIWSRYEARVNSIDDIHSESLFDDFLKLRIKN
jgi:hypothetical protein